MVEEADLLASLKHRGVVQTQELIESENYISVVSELCTGGELFDRILSFRYISENLVANFVLQIASALEACHRVGLVHRDLKPENILFANKTKSSMLKISDFVFSTKSEAMFGTVILTQTYYMAP